MTTSLTGLHKVNLDWITPDSEKVLARHARVSCKDPDKPEFIRLLKYCINHGHVSVFEQVCASFEIITSRSISAQILRHRSFCFQETSQRYCNPLEVLSDHVLNPADFDLRGQDSKNRQNSIKFENSILENKYRDDIYELYERAQNLYEAMTADGIARECARNVLPMGTPTRMHMQGNLRNWIFYVGLRCAPGTQLEHKYIASLIGKELKALLPDTILAVIQAAWEDRSLGLAGWKHLDDDF